jgi:aspartate 1-decarboxylase
MLIQIMKSKIHRARITQANVNYIGSITIDPVLMNAANIIPGEKVQVLNISNGERLETYAIEGEKSGEIGINGPAALKMQVGDIVIIVSYAFLKQDVAQKHHPTIIFPNEISNSIIE